MDERRYFSSSAVTIPCPSKFWGRLRRGITPEINAISTLIFAVSVALIVIWYRLRARTIGTQAQELLERT